MIPRATPLYRVARLGRWAFTIRGYRGRLCRTVHGRANRHEITGKMRYCKPIVYK